MNAETFVNEMRMAAPEKSILLKSGLSQEDADEFWNSYIADEKREGSINGDPILDLISRFDCQNIVIGMFRFLPEAIKEADGIRIGKIEVDPVIIDRETGELISKDRETGMRTMWPIAVNSEKFLEAILEAAKFFTKIFVGEENEESQTEREKTLEHCFLIAGGERYKRFFKMLLSIDD